MSYGFRFPDLGEGITEAELRKWLVKEGDFVVEHQALLEVETDKAVAEVPSPRKGRILRILKQEGEILKVGEVFVTIAEAAEDAEAGLADAASAAEAPAARGRSSLSVVGELPEAGPELSATGLDQPEPGSGPPPPAAAAREKLAARALATPAARALAKAKGLAIEAIRGSGPRGSVTREDVLAAAGRGDYGPVELVPMSGLRRTIARRLALAQSKVVSVTAMEEADISGIAAIRERQAEELAKSGISLSYLPFIVKAVQKALARHPSLNASIDEARETLILKKYYDFGIAVDTDEGLMVPVLRGVDRKSILDIARELETLAARARTRSSGPGELEGASFTISNYGSLGGGFSTPLVNYPEVAILGCGRAADRPWAVRGNLVVRKVLPLSLSFDHRAADGGEAARFLGELKAYLEDPGRLLLESI
jgi:pyruvate dehydrogenase E2 component (dihydrolipoamide acetyltransferase)